MKVIEIKISTFILNIKRKLRIILITFDMFPEIHNHALKSRKNSKCRPELNLVCLHKPQSYQNDNFNFYTFSWKSVLNILKTLNYFLVFASFLNGLGEITWANFRANPCVNILAQTPEELQSFSQNLRDNCAFPETKTISTSTTKSPKECLFGCTLQEETDELIIKVNDQSKNIEAIGKNLNKVKQSNAKKAARQEGINAEMLQLIKKYEERTTELEKQLREINANPQI